MMFKKIIKEAVTRSACVCAGLIIVGAIIFLPYIVKENK